MHDFPPDELRKNAQNSRTKDTEEHLIHTTCFGVGWFHNIQFHTRPRWWSFLAKKRLPESLNGLLNSPQGGFPSQHFQGLKQWRSILPSADGHSDGLEHLSGFYAHLLRSSAEVLVQGVVFEFSLRQHFSS